MMISIKCSLAALLACLSTIVVSIGVPQIPTPSFQANDALAGAPLESEERDPDEACDGRCMVDLQSLVQVGVKIKRGQELEVDSPKPEVELEPTKPPPSPEPALGQKKEKQVGETKPAGNDPKNADVPRADGDAKPGEENGLGKVGWLKHLPQGWEGSVVDCGNEAQITAVEAKVEERALSFMLIGAVSFIMMLFYLVNARSDEVRMATWRMTSATISVFSAVMMYRCVKRIFVENSPRATHDVCWLLVGLFVICFVCAQGSCLFFLKRRYEKIALASYTTLLGRVAAFAATFGFAAMQEVHPFCTSWLWSLSVAGIAAITLVLFFWIAFKVRSRVVVADDFATVDEEAAWNSEVEILEDDMISFCVGFLIMQAVRFKIKGGLQPYDPSTPPVGITETNAHMLMFVSIIFFSLTFLVALYVDHKRKMRLLQVHDKLGERITNCSLHISFLTMGWCLIFWGEWQVIIMEIANSRIACCIIASLVLTFLCVAGLFVFGYLGERFGILEHTLRSFVIALGAIVGASWGRVFNIAFLDISYEHSLKGMNQSMALVILVSALCIVVLPAWRFYILPKTMRLPNAEPILTK
eukprot:gnl/TRDRNA2_/TRDRNA2_187330_c0_seq1.p1 gnl/TRDRNA2_/TRDRNA2_187330_c0~~gnl/TRDRNA2_/TRDRNA2_187330_c0_seq1.p1  ORF type:complete len:585 (+),score=117.75 gnl/TRDRNA2_/TRDRNA2_187330_c0_seq1:33-1787(+)